MNDRLERVLLYGVAAIDRVVPKSATVAVRTSPDLEDQARQLVAALDGAGVTTAVLIDRMPPGVDLPPAVRVLVARTPRGLWSYWRAQVVVHSHGVFGSLPGSRCKRFLNVWHGMPIKRLPAGSAVGRHQTDRTIATAPVHARHLAETWRLEESQVAITGLPRNDVLASDAHPERPDVLRRLVGDRPLLVWLPTFRSQVGTTEVDGVDVGSVTQFAGASVAAVDALCERLGAFAIVKPHPLAPPVEGRAGRHVAVWDERDLEAAGLTLYELLAHAEVLISDHSSVWVDFLLTGRPMVFAVSDLDDYRESRGFYFDDIEALLPGPLVTDVAGLERELARLLAGDDRWAGARRSSLAEHHVHTDARSSERVAALVVEMLRR